MSVLSTKRSTFSSGWALPGLPRVSSSVVIWIRFHGVAEMRRIFDFHTITSMLFADNVVLLTSSERVLQPAVVWSWDENQKLQI